MPNNNIVKCIFRHWI